MNSNVVPATTRHHSPIGLTLAIVLAVAVLAGLVLWLVDDYVPAGWRSYVIGFVAAAVSLATIVICNLLYRRPRSPRA